MKSDLNASKPINISLRMSAIVAGLGLLLMAVLVMIGGLSISRN